MGLPQVIGGVMQAGTGLASGVQGKRAARKGDELLGQNQQRYNEMMQAAFPGLADLAGGNPQLRDQIYTTGQQAANDLSGIFGRGAEALGTPSDLLNQAQGLLGSGGLEGLLSGLGQAGGQLGIGSTFQGFDPTGMRNVAGPQQTNFDLQQFNFDPVRSQLDQAMQAGQGFADNARASALEQSALGFQGAQQQLDAALASRGVASNSGVAAASSMNLANQGAQQRSMLERDLANQQAQTALQFTGLDTQNALNLAGMGSQYNLGFNQLGQQGAQNAFGQSLAASQFGLGREQSLAQLGLQSEAQRIGGIQADNNLAAQLAQSGQANDLARAAGLQGLQGQLDQRLLQGVDLQRLGATSGLDLLQGIYQQNYLNPQMQVGMGLLQNALGGFSENLGYYGQGAAAGGAGKGAQTGQLFEGLQGMGGGKGATTRPTLSGGR